MKTDLINHEYKFRYVVIPKAASRTILNYFKGNEIISMKLRDRLNINWKPPVDYYTWTIVRHPVDRLISCYKNKVVTDNPDIIKHILEPQGLKPNISFDEFCNFVCKQGDESADAHWLSQYEYLKGVNWWGKMETIQRDFNRLCKILHMPKGDLRHINKSPDMTIIPTRKQIQMIKERYLIDFNILRYEANTRHHDV